MVDKELLKGSTPMLILSILAGGPNYGYEIAKQIGERSEGILEGKEGTLYPLLHQLELKGWLSSYKEKVAGRTRKYYRITPKGKAVLARMLDDWESFAQAVQKTVSTVKKLKLDPRPGGTK